ncbi:cation diffusion facilitator family transporter [Aeromonas schubertii]|uniref:Cation efflux family protein n=1 Tax=Aeromonas schubertii TaxID=652 RepID=A0A0S2SGV5_9GAMM|nr:cation diffusion facilitator family transporter [Aeromonas schubertii]ALP40947.1 cation efflux family protein [Aeromonas schubertii]
MNRKRRAALLSVCSNSVLIVAKLVVGLLTGAVSIISEAIHSAMDLVASLIAFFSVSRSDAPPDACHPYGHDKIENISGVIEALLILAASLWILLEAGSRLFAPEPLTGPGWGVLVMGGSALVNVLVSRHLYRVAREEESLALEADALHLKADVLTSLGVSTGLLLIWGGMVLGWDLARLDPLVAIGVALFILKEAAELLARALRGLLDHRMEEGELDSLEALLRERCPRGTGYHDLRSRQSGRRRHIDFHLTVPPAMTVDRAHALCDELEEAILGLLPHAVVLIHVEPDSVHPL